MGTRQWGMARQTRVCSDRSHPILPPLDRSGPRSPVGTPPRTLPRPLPGQGMTSAHDGGMAYGSWRRSAVSPFPRRAWERAEHEGGGAARASAPFPRPVGPAQSARRTTHGRASLPSGRRRRAMGVRPAGNRTHGLVRSAFPSTGRDPRNEPMDDTLHQAVNPDRNPPPLPHERHRVVPDGRARLEATEVRAARPLHVGQLHLVRPGRVRLVHRLGDVLAQRVVHVQRHVRRRRHAVSHRGPTRIVASYPLGIWLPPVRAVPIEPTPAAPVAVTRPCSA